MSAIPAALAFVLLSAPPENSIEDLGFEPLFNGEDLSGWVVPDGDNGHWKVVDGVIDYDAGSEAEGEKNLVSERTFRDFVAEIEWRLKPDGPLDTTPIILPDGSYLRDAAGNIVSVPRQNPDSGVYVRGHSRAQLNLWAWPVGSGEMYGYRHSDKNPAELRAAVTPSVRADKPLGEWNRFTIVAIGRTVTVLLNDRLIIDRAELPDDFPLEGPITLQHHGGYKPDGSVRPKSSLVQFRNIYVKELPTADDAAE